MRSTGIAGSRKQKEKNLSGALCIVSVTWRLGTSSLVRKEKHQFILTSTGKEIKILF
jgi:hypothetical protein